MTLTYSSGKFVLRCSFEEKDIAKGAGCRWNPEQKHWWTDRAEVARKLERFADGAAKAMLGKAAERIEASRMASADIEIPVPEGLEYMAFQKAGIAYCMDRPNVLIADQMGLGKTIQALGLINMDPSIKNVLCICPASLRINWAREAEKWLTRKFRINVMTADWVKTVEGFNIINYDILSRLDKDREWDMLIADESHLLKNPKAKRSREVTGYQARERAPGTVKKNDKAVYPIKAKRKLLLTGTPIVNRPIELYNLIHYLDPERWSNWFWYAKHFCGAEQGRWGMDVSGATNLGELQDALRSTCMLRRLKCDVLKDLPSKRRVVIEIPANGCSGVIARENRLFEQIRERAEAMEAEMELARAGTEDEYKAAVARLRGGQVAAFTEMAQIRHETAVSKIPYVVEHVISTMEETDCLIVWVHHHDVAAGIRAGLKEKGISSVQLTGENTMEERQAAVDAFQNGKAQVFVGGIQAAGVGITLTRASTALFAELDWVPGNVSQAEDRCHRIGQTESVLIQHLVLEGSIDAVMAKRIVQKQEVIDKALDVMVRDEPVLPIREARKSVTRDDLKKAAAELAPAEIARIHAGLRYLADMDRDHARTVNGIGFNKIDGRIGHSLARCVSLTNLQAALGKKILFKYKIQLEGTI